MRIFRYAKKLDVYDLIELFVINMKLINLLISYSEINQAPENSKAFLCHKTYNNAYSN